MTITDRITLNECDNNGTSLYIYKIKDGGLAFGYSAYNLKQIIDCNCCFSSEMQMPIAEINDNQLIELLNKPHSELDGYYHFKIETTIAFEDYRDWISSLM